MINGLYLFVNKSGKYWRWDYAYNGKRKTAAYGTYPKVSLKEARALNTEAHKIYSQGIDPNQYKKLKQQQNQEQSTAKSQTFQVVSLEWFKFKHSEGGKHAQTIISRLRVYVFPFIGSLPVSELKRQHIANVVKEVVEQGKVPTAKKVSQICKQILEYACDSGYIDTLPIGTMSSLFPETAIKHMPSILEPMRIGELMRSIQSYKGNYVIRMALRVLPYMFVRSQEFRLAKWRDINLADAVWTIPAKDRKLTKLGKQNPDYVHLVPLAHQAVEIFTKLKPFTGHGLYVFPSTRSSKGILSDSTINTVLHSLGFRHQGNRMRRVFFFNMCIFRFYDKNSF